MRKSSSEFLLEVIQLRGRVVLDVGCGDGALTRLMAGRGAIVTGLEPNPARIDAARAFPHVGGETYLVAGAQNLPAGDATVDLVVFSNSLHHVPVEDQQRALEEAARVLRPGGIVFVAEPLAEGAHFELVRNFDDETEIRAKAYEALNAVQDEGALVEEREVVMTAPIRYASFEEFRDRVVAIEPARAAVARQKDALLRDAFLRLGAPDGDGRLFDQPVRVTVLRRPKA